MRSPIIIIIAQFPPDLMLIFLCENEYKISLPQWRLTSISVPKLIRRCRQDQLVSRGNP